MNLTSNKLFAAQALAHIATIYWLTTFFTPLNALYVFLVYFITGCLGMSIIYHRFLTHRSFKTNKYIEYIGTFFATVGLTGSSITWTAAHRQHHSNADRSSDPHSPSMLGYIKAQWFSMYSPIDIRRSPVISSSVHRLFHKYYLHINLLYSVILFAMGGIYALTTFYLVPACLLWNAGSLINTVCHTKWLGYRRYNTPDSSVNNPLLGILMWGEGWHNNHHRYQNRPNIGERWWEIDAGRLIIRMLGTEHETKT